MKNKDYYFRHDYNPTNDPKIICLLGNFGGNGYGIYWRIVEMLHQEKDYKLPLKKYIYEAIAKQMLTSAEQIEAIIYECINTYELFVSDSSFFWSERVLDNIKRQEEISNIRSLAGKSGAIAKQNLANASKEKKSKVNKINKSIIISEQGSQSDNIISLEIGSLIKEFEEINPTIKYNNKTQRKACEELISKFGYEKVVATLNYYKSIRGEKFSPVITTPYELQQKMGQLLTFYNKSTNKPKTIIL
jgi:hypothetical protein